MSEQLFIGDVHARPDDLEDCERLMEGIEQTLGAHPNVSTLWFLGDLHHTHAWLHVDVQAFWIRWLRKFAKDVDVNIVVGNHDLAPSGNNASQAYLFEGVRVFDTATVHDGIGVVPYMSSSKFVECVKGLGPSSTLICHQTFAGAQFENGFYAPEGIDPALLPHEQVISGHIHEPQKLRNGNRTVEYFGSPRWISLNDANSDRYVFLAEIEDGRIQVKQPISTSQWCRKIVRAEVGPATPPPFHINPAWDYHFDLKGPKAWCEEHAPKYSLLGKVRTFAEQTTSAKVRESEGVFPAFRKFIDGYEAPNATPKEILQAMVEERFNG